MDPLQVLDDAKVGSNNLDITPKRSTVDPFAEDFAPTEPAPQPVPQSNNQPELQQEAPGFGAPLSKEENAYLREMIRRGMEQDAMTQAATSFIQNHPDYIPSPDSWNILQKIIVASGADPQDPGNWDLAFGVAKTEGIIETRDAPSETGNSELDTAAREDRIARRDQFQQERARLNAPPTPTVRTGVPDFGTPPPEDEGTETPEQFQARVAAMPIDEARRAVQAAMQNLRRSQGGFEPAPRRRVPMADFNNRRPF